MPIFTVLLAAAAGAAALISGISNSQSSKIANSTAEKNRIATEEHQQKLFEAAEKQKKEVEKAQRKTALQRALRVPGAQAVVKRVPGVRPLKQIFDPRIAQKTQTAQIFKGLSGAFQSAIPLFTDVSNAGPKITPKKTAMQTDINFAPSPSPFT